MRHVRRHHQEVAVADTCVAAPAFGATVNVDVLAKNIVRPDCQVGLFIVELEILRRNANHAEGIKTIVVANSRGPFENDVGVENAAIADGNAFTDSAERANADALAEAGAGMDDGCGMNQFLFPVPE